METLGFHLRLRLTGDLNLQAILIAVSRRVGIFRYFYKENSTDYYTFRMADILRATSES